MKKLFLSMLLLALPLLASAYDCQVDGIYYNLKSSTKEAEVTYREWNSDEETILSDYSGEVIIPENFTYDGVDYNVTCIGTEAFENCRNLTSVVIPNSVITIGDSAFRDCSGLTSVTIPKSLTTIEICAFLGCTSLTSITIPNSVTTLGYAAFYNCCSLTSVTIPNSVTTIEYEVFSGCSNLSSVTIPNSVTLIEGYAFFNCSNLVSVTIPNSVIDIEVGAFEGCKKLTSVTINSNSIMSKNYNYSECGISELFGPQINTYIIGDEVKSIGGSAFIGCDNLSSVTIPNSVVSIGELAFYGCNSLTSLTIPNSVNSIGEEAFNGCSGLTSVTIPSSVTTIGGWAFAGCSSLTSLTIPNSLATIADGAFQGCSSLTSLTIPNSLTTIADCAFQDCTSLISVTIPNSVTSIRSDAFSGCSSLATVTIPNSVTSIESNVFYGCNSLTSVTIPNSVKFIRNGAFANCSNLTSVIIPKSVIGIEVGAFEGCKKLISVTINSNSIMSKNYDYSEFGISEVFGPQVTNYIIGDDVYAIGNTAFYHCSSITSITIGNNVKSIGWYAFDQCNMSSVVIPNSVKTIDNGAFFLCQNLTSVTIGNSVKSIGEWAFEGSSVSSVYISDLSAWCDIDFQTHDANPLWYPDTHLYLNGEEIKELVIPNNVTSIGKFAFCGYQGLSSVTIPNTVKSIGEYAFTGCPLTSIFSKMEEPCSIEETCFSNDVEDSNDPNYDYVYNNAILYVPKGTVDKYRSTDYWSKFVHIEAMDFTDYTLTYEVDGETYSTYTLKEGDTITPEGVPTKEGYTFSGWSEIPATMPASDVTITGSFTVNKYKLTYTLDGEEYKTAEADYGTALTPEEAPVKEGYTFSGWSEIPETMPANDVTVTGTFTVNKYKLTYIVDGEEYKASEVDYGTAITAEAVPTKEGYTFSGWSEIPSIMPAEDVTVTGTFTVNKYTITYMVDDAVLMTEEVAYGSTIAPPKSQKDGYDILWSSHPTTMPAYDITIYGTYTTVISSLSMEENDRQVFTPDGKRVETPKKGLNIIRKSDGTIKKVVVK